MRSCPKCDQRLPASARHCGACGTPVAFSAYRIGAPERGLPLTNPLLQAFERDERAWTCPDCLCEYAHRTLCKRCDGLELEHWSASRWRASCERNPLAELAGAVSAPPESRLHDCVRVTDIRGVEAVRNAARELAFLGIQPRLGSDSLDPFQESDRVGLYVRQHEVEAARYVLDGLKPPDPDAVPPSQEAPELMRLRDEAAAWMEWGKYRQVLEHVDARLAFDPEGERLALLALAFQFRFRTARERLERVVAALPPGRERARLLFEGARIACLGREGDLGGKGSDPDLARDLLEQAATEAPRRVEITMARIEFCEWRHEPEALPALLRDLERANPNLLGRDGRWRALRHRLRSA